MRIAASVFTAIILSSAFSYAADPPAKTLDLSLWKLTLPIDTSHPGRPDEIVAPALATFVSPGIF